MLRKIQTLELIQFNLSLTVTLGTEERGRCRDNREFKQQGCQRRRKRHFKSEFALLQTLSRLFDIVQFVKCWQFSGGEFQKTIEFQGRKIKSSCVLVLHKT